MSRCDPPPPTLRCLLPCMPPAMLALLLASTVQPASAHPSLGDFIQHRVSIRVDAVNTDIEMELVFNDMRAMAERYRMDGDHNRTISPAEVRQYALATADAISDRLTLSIDGRDLELISLHDPEIDLNAQPHVAPVAYVLHLFFFARTPPGLHAGSELVLGDGLWPAAPALCTLMIEGSNGIRLRPAPAGEVFPASTVPASRLLRVTCTAAPQSKQASAMIADLPVPTRASYRPDWPALVLVVFALLCGSSHLTRRSRGHAMRKLPISYLVALMTCIVLSLLTSTARAQPAGVREMLDQLTREHAYLFSGAENAKLDELNRQFREAENEIRRRNTPEAQRSARQQQEDVARRLVETLEHAGNLVRVTLQESGLAPPDGGTVQMLGAAGAMLLKIDNGPGEAHYITHNIDFSQIQWERALVEVQVGRSGTTWAVIGLTHLPAQRTHSGIRFTREGGQMLHWPIDFVTADQARLKLKITSEDGTLTPAMLRLIWRTGGSFDVRPANAIDITPQFDAQGSPASRRSTNLPGLMSGEFWCVPGPLDMMISPGDYHITIRRGIEQVPIDESFAIKPGETLEKTYTVKRWVDMRKNGWYSGDDHVHNRIMSDDDARRLMTWVKAEDIHLANIVKMGDIYRTWFEQRGFGKEYRVIDGDYILSPGQECPRTHGQIGHTLSMNTTSMVRDTDRYYAYDWVANTVHAQGGLWGYAHVNSDMFYVHRDMSMNIPAGNVDFVEMLQFFHLGTDLYYDFLNLGYKMTASAGSDVPWGGSIGEARVYARVESKAFSADAWFDSLRRGHTLVTDGPMIDFHVDEAIPGDEIKVTGNRKLKIKARAWGDPGRMLPIQLDIVGLGDVIKSIRTDGNGSEAKLEFELDAGQGLWIAARAEGGDGTKAHTTPVYVVREGMRFWKFDAVEALIAKRLASLDEVERIVKEAKDAVAKGGIRTREAGEDRAIGQLALQGDDLLKRVAAARKTFAELKQAAEKERALRGSK